MYKSNVEIYCELYSDENVECHYNCLIESIGKVDILLHNSAFPQCSCDIGECQFCCNVAAIKPWNNVQYENFLRLLRHRSRDIIVICIRSRQSCSHKSWVESGSFMLCRGVYWIFYWIFSSWYLVYSHTFPFCCGCKWLIYSSLKVAHCSFFKKIHASYTTLCNGRRSHEVIKILEIWEANLHINHTFVITSSSIVDPITDVIKIVIILIIRCYNNYHCLFSWTFVYLFLQ